MWFTEGSRLKFVFGVAQGHRAQKSQVTYPGLHSENQAPRHNDRVKAGSPAPSLFFPEYFRLFVWTPQKQEDSERKPRRQLYYPRRWWPFYQFKLTLTPYSGQSVTHFQQVIQPYLFCRMQPCPNITFLVLPVLQLAHTCFFTVVSKTGSLKCYPEPARRAGRWLGWFSSSSSYVQGERKLSQKQTNKKVNSENKRKIRYNPSILLHRTNSDGHKF